MDYPYLVKYAIDILTILFQDIQPIYEHIHIRGDKEDQDLKEVDL